jgi:hypothetical protein
MFAENRQQSFQEGRVRRRWLLRAKSNVEEDTASI